MKLSNIFVFKIIIMSTKHHIFKEIDLITSLGNTLLKGKDDETSKYVEINESDYMKFRTHLLLFIDDYFGKHSVYYKLFEPLKGNLAGNVKSGLEILDTIKKRMKLKHNE